MVTRVATKMVRMARPMTSRRVGATVNIVSPTFVSNPKCTSCLATSPMEYRRFDNRQADFLRTRSAEVLS